MTRKPHTGEEDIQTPEDTTKTAESETPKTPSTPDNSTAQSGVVGKVKKMFRRALMLSVIAHAPVICGSFTDQNNKWEQKSFFDSGINVWDWQNDLKEDLKKEQNIDEKEAEKIISEVEPDILEGLEKARRAIEIRKSEREKNINPDRVKNHKDEIRRKLEAGEQILFRDFIFESEEITMGIEPEIVKNAQKIFFEEMAALEKEKPEVPTREFLRRIVSYSEEKDAEIGGAYETTQASLSVYLDRKGKGLRGNCEARGKYMAMALESLYPERWEDVYMQNLADHIRTLFKVGETTYMMEPGIPILTEKDRAGTIIYKPQKIIERYAGLKSDSIKVEGEVEEKDTKSNLPTMSDTNSEAFPTPKADGRLKMASRDHSNLYKPKLAPPEVRDMELPRTIKGKKQEEKKKPEVKDEKKSGQNGEKPDTKDEAIADSEFVNISEWEIVTDDKGEMTEVLPIKPRDYSDPEISERVQSDRFYSDEVHLDTDERSIFNPTPATIKKINSLALATVVYGDVTLFGQQALNEAFKTGAGEIIFNLKHPHMPMSLEQAFRHSKSAKEYKGEIQININRDLKGRTSVVGDEQGLSPDQFELLMDGKGGLMLNYQQRKNFDDEEIKAVAKSGRPYVMMSGAVCEGNVEALRHMNASKGSVLVLDGNRFVRAALKNPAILENPNIKPVEEMFYGRGGWVVNASYDALFNAYLLEYKSEVTGIGMLAKDRLKKYIALLEHIHLEALVNVREEHREAAGRILEGLRDKALESFRKDMENVSPIGSIGACLIPETVEEAEAMGVKTVSETNERGVTFTQNWSGEINVKDGIKKVTVCPVAEKSCYRVRLLNGMELTLGWMTHEDVYVDNAIAGPAQKITVNGRGFSVKDGEEQAFIGIQDNGLIAIRYPDNKFIEFKLEGRPEKPREEKETGGFTALLGPEATEIQLAVQSDGIIRLTTEAFGRPAIYVLKPLEEIHIRVPGDMIQLGLSVDSKIIEIKGGQTTGRFVINDTGLPEFEGTNIAIR